MSDMQEEMVRKMLRNMWINKKQALTNETMIMSDLKVK